MPQELDVGGRGLVELGSAKGRAMAATPTITTPGIRPARSPEHQLEDVGIHTPDGQRPMIRLATRIAVTGEWVRSLTRASPSGISRSEGPGEERPDGHEGVGDHRGQAPEEEASQDDHREDRGVEGKRRQEGVEGPGGDRVAVRGALSANTKLYPRSGRGAARRCRAARRRMPGAPKHDRQAGGVGWRRSSTPRTCRPTRSSTS